MSTSTVPFTTVFRDATSGNVKTKASEYRDAGAVPVIDQGQGLIAGYVDDLDRICDVDPPVIVFGDHTKVFKYVDFEFAMGADGTKILVPRVEADLRYLYWALSRIHLPEVGYSRHFKFLKECEIPLPSLPEQKRIAAILDAADALRAKRRESLEHLDALVQSVFLDMFGDPVTNPKEWATVRFGDIGDFNSGATPRKSRADFWEGSIPWVSPKDMKVPVIHDSQDHVTELAFEETNLKVLPPGCLLIVVRGMILAHSFPVATNAVPVSINQDMKGIELSERFRLEFVLACMRNLKRRIVGEVSSAGHGTRRFDAEAMKRVSVPVPPLDQQERFEEVSLAARSLAELLKAHLAELDTLFASLQSRAFRGEL